MKVVICGVNGLPLMTDGLGDLLSVTSGIMPTESEHNDGYYTEALLLGLNSNTLIPILINENGELLL